MTKTVTTVKLTKIVIIGMSDNNSNNNNSSGR